jgi:hypothetical protein
MEGGVYNEDQDEEKDIRFCIACVHVWFVGSRVVYHSIQDLELFKPFTFVS